MIEFSLGLTVRYDEGRPFGQSRVELVVNTGEGPFSLPVCDYLGDALIQLQNHVIAPGIARLQRAETSVRHEAENTSGKENPS
jgi:hypothetical protein